MKVSVAYVIAAAFCVLPASIARAAVAVEISAGALGHLIVIDNAAGDLNPAVGAIRLAPEVTVGDVTVGGLAVQSSSPTALLAADLQFIRMNSTEPRTFAITFTGTDFAVPDDDQSFITASASATFAVLEQGTATTVAGAQISVETYADASNAPFARNPDGKSLRLIAPDGPITSVTGSPATAVFNPTGSFSFTIQNNFDLPADTQVVTLVNAIEATPVPEPAAIGLALPSVLWALRRRRST